jgi:hypothetical protein
MSENAFFASCSLKSEWQAGGGRKRGGTGARTVCGSCVAGSFWTFSGFDSTEV